MKLKIINPAVGISEGQIEIWQQYLKKYLLPGTVLKFENISAGFPSVENETHDIINGAEALKLVKKANEQGFQGVFINCFNDPGVIAAREFSEIPVLGPYEPAVLFGSALTDRMAIISTDQYGLLSEGRKAQLHRTWNRLYKVMDVDLSVLELSDEETLLNRLIQCCKELETEQVGVAVLGCTGMGRIADALERALREQELRIQVIEPLRIGVTMLEYMVRMGHTNRIYGAKIGEFSD